ncbi:MAG: hypothetical protein GY742_09710 [Hyphomicrobiales bacterium]|nr:hypothetical protein [Hyphomicrobiales bacterium]
MIKIDRIDHLVLTVSSIANTCDFYCENLGMDRYSRTHLYDPAIQERKATGAGAPPSPRPGVSPNSREQKKSKLNQN